jgi:hypothetical protein
MSTTAMPTTKRPNGRPTSTGLSKRKEHLEESAEEDATISEEPFATEKQYLVENTTQQSNQW